MHWEKQQKFSIRKFAIGAASVLIGQFFVGQNLGDQVVAADEAAALVEGEGVATEQPALAANLAESTTTSDTASAGAAHSEETPAPATVNEVAPSLASPATETASPAAETTAPKTETMAPTTEVTTDLAHPETVHYKVSYVDENGQVIYTTVKEAIIQSGQESVTVTEDGRELANEAALANYGDESGNSLVRTATITRGGTTEIVYQVKAFANPEPETNTGSREATIDYTIVYKDKQTDVEVYRETKSYTQPTYDTKLTADHLIQPDIKGIAQLKDYKLLETSKVARLTEGQPNLVTFALESLVKKEREKRGSMIDPGDGSLYLKLRSKDQEVIRLAPTDKLTNQKINFDVGNFFSIEKENRDAAFGLTDDAKALGFVIEANYNGYITLVGPLDGSKLVSGDGYQIGVYYKKDPRITAFATVGLSKGQNADPYITLERTYGSDSRSDVNFTQKKNGTMLDVSYRVGLTRIAVNEVELTEDAKQLGLTLKTAGDGYVISGTVPLDNRTRVRNYVIGVQSKTQPKLVRATAYLTILY